MNIRQARKIVRRTLRCFDYWPRFGRPGYTIDQARRASLRILRHTHGALKYKRYILECAMVFLAEQK